MRVCWLPLLVTTLERDVRVTIARRSSLGVTNLVKLGNLCAHLYCLDPRDSIFDAIDARLDLTAACDELAIPADARALISALYNEPTLSERSAGQTLGWPLQRLQRVVRSLRADRRLGQGLRGRLGAYQKKSPSSVRESKRPAA